MAQDSLNSSRRASLFYLGWLAAVAIVLGTLASLVLAREVWIRRQSGALEAESRRGRPVLVEPVSFAPKARTVVFPGDVHGFYETELFAKVPGYIRSIKVDKGTRVRKGQPLAEIESPELDHQVQDARADYNLRIVTDRRFQEMVRHGAASQQQADQTHADMLQARAHWLSLEAQQAYERVEAPFDGVITARNVDPGALVTLNTASTGAVPLLAIATLKPLRVYVRMPQEQAVYVKDGDPAVVRGEEFTAREFKGSVTRQSQALAAATRTMLVEVDLPNDDLALRPGMYARVGVAIRGSSGAPLVPDDTLIFKDGKVFVPVVRGERLHLAEVTLGYDDGIKVETVSGLSGDELIAMNVGQAAEEGELVRARRIDQPR